MQELSKLKWVGRLFNKHNIEDALAGYTTMLDEAERAFQTATLIEIHYSVNLLQQKCGHGSIPMSAPAAPLSVQSEDSEEVVTLNSPPPYEPCQTSRPLDEKVDVVNTSANDDALAGQSLMTEQINDLVEELKDIEKSGVSRLLLGEEQLLIVATSLNDITSQKFA